MNPTDSYDPQVETAKTEAKEAYMAIDFLYVPNHNRYGHIMNKLHNAFRMGWDKYPKDVISTYDLAIKCKGGTVSMAVPPNDGVDFLTDDRGQDRDMHATDGSIILTRSGEPMECHIYVMKHSNNRCPNR